MRERRRELPRVKRVDPFDFDVSRIVATTRLFQEEKEEGERRMRHERIQSKEKIRAQIERFKHEGAELLAAERQRMNTKTVTKNKRIKKKSIKTKDRSPFPVLSPTSKSLRVKKSTIERRNYRTDYYVKAMKSFKAQEPGDLSFEAGEIIHVTRENDSGWFHGRLISTDLEGMFPSNFVRKIEFSVAIEQQRDFAAAKLQSIFRGQKVRSLLRRRTFAATKIQARRRGTLGRIAVLERRYSKIES